MTPVLRARAALLGSAVLLAYLLAPALVIAPIENDGIRLALGAILEARGSGGRLIYRYDVQPGTYLLVGRLTSWDVFQAFSWLSLGAGVVYLVSSARTIHRTTSVPGWAAVLSLALLPEMWFAPTYPSSSILAASVLAFSTILLGRDKTPWIVAAGLLAGVAIWLRVDAVLGLPAALVLLWFRQKTLLPCLAWLVSACGSGALLLVLSGADPYLIAGEYLLHSAQGADANTTIGSTFSQLTGVVVALGAVGLRFAIKEDRPLFWIVLAGVAPTLLAYGFAATTPKYFLFALPHLGLAVALGIREVAGKSTRFTRALILAICVIQYIIPFPPPYARVRTADGPRPITGIWTFIPGWTQERTKVRSTYRDVQERIRGYTSRHPTAQLVTLGWTTEAFVPYQLASDGFLPISVDNREGFVRVEMARNTQRVVIASFLDRGPAFEAYLPTTGGALIVGE